MVVSQVSELEDSARRGFAVGRGIEFKNLIFFFKF